MFSFKDKKVLISGGSTGIGFETIKILIDKGAKVHSLSRTKPMLDHPNLRIYLIDLYEKTPELDDFYDVVILNLGANPGQKTFEELTIEEIERFIYLNLNIHLLMLKLVRCNKIVFVNSVLSMIGVPNNSLYCACKSFISTFNESLRGEGKDTYIICPYNVNTHLFSEVQDFLTLDKALVAKSIISDVEKERKYRVLPGIFRIFPMIKAIIPISGMDYIVKTLLNLFIKKKSD